MSKKIVVCDIDGILADFVGGVLTEYTKLTGEVVSREAVFHYDMARCLPRPALFTSFYSDPNVLRDLLPIDGAVEGLAKLKDAFDVWIVTARNPDDNRGVETSRWLERYFGWNLPVIYAKDKYSIFGDLLIDDSSKQANNFRIHHANAQIFTLANAYNGYENAKSFDQRFLSWRSMSNYIVKYYGEEEAENEEESDCLIDSIGNYFSKHTP